MVSIPLIGAIQAFFVAFLIYKKRAKAMPDNWLLAVLIMWGIRFVFMLLRDTEEYENMPWVMAIQGTLVYLNSPLIYFYFRSIHTRKGPTARDLVHLVPSAVALLYMVSSVLLKSGEEVISGFQNLNFDPASNAELALDDYLRLLPGMVSVISYTAFSYVLFRKYMRTASQIHSNPEYVYMDWTRNIMISLVALVIVPESIWILSAFIHVLPYAQLDNFLQLTAVANVFVVGYNGIQQRYAPFQKQGSDSAAQELESVVSNGVKRYEKYKLSGKRIDEIMTIVSDYLESDHTYLRSDLNINSLADELDIPTHQLSQAINAGTGKPFFDLINSYRIQHFKRRLAEPNSNQFTLLALALDSGFNAKSSFNRIFKEHTGITPSEYKKQTLNS